jgi:hypothetical protein
MHYISGRVVAAFLALPNQAPEIPHNEKSCYNSSPFFTTALSLALQ